jgi:hypothetical protein
MKNYQETTEILKSFYSECLRFWKRENVENAAEYALKDLANIKCDPYSPNGETLDKKAITDFINNTQK